MQQFAAGGRLVAGQQQCGMTCWLRWRAGGAPGRVQVESGSICQAEVALTGFDGRNRATGLLLPTLLRLLKGGAMRHVGGHPLHGVDGSGGGQEGPAGGSQPTTLTWGVVGCGPRVAAGEVAAYSGSEDVCQCKWPRLCRHRKRWRLARPHVTSMFGRCWGGQPPVRKKKSFRSVV